MAPYQPTDTMQGTEWSCSFSSPFSFPLGVADSRDNIHAAVSGMQPLRDMKQSPMEV